jgi:hypothetical protein
MERCRPSREARRREIEAPPEEVDGTRLADESGLERTHQAVRLQQAAPEQLDVARVVGGMLLVRLEGDGLGDLDRSRRDPNVDPEASQPGHELAVEPCDRLRLERHRERAALAIRDQQAMIDEVEVDLEPAAAVRNRRRGQAARADVQRHVPPVVEGRGERQAHLSDDLRPHVDGGDGRSPVLPRELRPGVHGCRHGCRRQVGGHLAATSSPSSGRPASSQSSSPPE